MPLMNKSSAASNAFGPGFHLGLGAGLDVLRFLEVGARLLATAEPLQQIAAYAWQQMIGLKGGLAHEK